MINYKNVDPCINQHLHTLHMQVPSCPTADVYPRYPTVSQCPETSHFDQVSLDHFQSKRCMRIEYCELFNLMLIGQISVYEL